MVNGNNGQRSEYPDLLISRQEFAPYAKNTEYLLIKDGQNDIILKNMGDNMSSIAKDMKKLVQHDELRSALLKIGIKFGGTCLTLVTAYSTGFVGLLEKLIIGMVKVLGG